MIYIVIMFTALGALFGSEPVTKNNIRDGVTNIVSFEVNKPFQTVFSNLMSASNKCFLDQPFNEQITVWGERNNSNNTANIRIQHVYAKKSREMYIMVDIASIGDKQSKVSVYSPDSNAVESMKRYKTWANNKPETC